MSFSTGLVKVTDIFAPMIERQLTANGVSMDQYSKQCVVNAIGSINAVLDKNGIDWNDPSLDRNNITHILLNIAALKLNAAASPREVYFQVRNVQVKKKIDGKEVAEWKKQIEMGIEGDGNDAILARFGRDIAKVGQFWLVREHDEFEYPVYTGFDVIPPKWKPTGKGEVVRVVYPILKKDGTVEFYIAEREDVARNLIAHIANNLMNETFGIAKSRFEAKPEELKKIVEKKKAILDKAKQLGLKALDDPELQQWISPAWTEYHSREAMIIRKMRNNIVKKIPKDFGNAFIEMTYHEATDETYAEVHREIAANANREPIDVEAQPAPDEAKEQSDLDHQSEPQPTDAPQPESERPAAKAQKADKPATDPWDDDGHEGQGVMDFGEPMAATASAGPGF